MITIDDRYKGVTIDFSSAPNSQEAFYEEIINLLKEIEDRPLVWIKIPINKSDFIPILTKLDFKFHHCNENNLMLVKKLDLKAIIPTAKNFTVGVGAVIRNSNKLLVIKDRFFAGYKLPGGHIEKYEKIKDAIKREVYEETGIQAEFESILNIGHFIHGQFDESNLYIVCTAKALTKNITIHDSHEILEAIWIDIEEFLNLPETNMYNKSVVMAAINNSELKLTEQQIKLRVAEYEVFF